AVSAEDCFLISRGLDTMAVRLRHQQASAERVARFLQRHPMVKNVLYPTLPESPDHPLWARDFKAAGPLLSLELVAAPQAAYVALFGRLK
ncbi:PLP-dependent transferase, partial [Priestia megaterium]|uniref:PLP-dependent transferase n=1 Tax=Priestia megaterium TaxID=1404 RepID=UPI0035B5D9B2